MDWHELNVIHPTNKLIQSCNYNCYQTDLPNSPERAFSVCFSVLRSSSFQRSLMTKSEKSKERCHFWKILLHVDPYKEFTDILYRPLSVSSMDTPNPPLAYSLICLVVFALWTDQKQTATLKQSTICILTSFLVLWNCHFCFYDLIKKCQMFSVFFMCMYVTYANWRTQQILYCDVCKFCVSSISFYLFILTCKVHLILFYGICAL